MKSKSQLRYLAQGVAEKEKSGAEVCYAFEEGKGEILWKCHFDLENLF